MITVRKYAVIALFLIPAAVNAWGVEGQGWRGAGAGAFFKADPATVWATTRTIVWSVPTDTWSNASPVVVRGKVLIQAEPFDLVCLSAKNGEMLWRRSNPLEEALSPEQKAEQASIQPQADALKAEIAAINKQIDGIKAERKANPADAALKDKQTALEKSRNELQVKLNPLMKFEAAPTQPTNGYSSPTPISDGKGIYALFGSGVAACYDLDGNRKWIRYVEKPTCPFGWGLSSSPRLVDGKLILHVADLWALDPGTGKELWRTATPIGWGTAFVTKIGKESVLATPGGAVVRASDGKILAKDLYKMPYGSAVVADGVIYSLDEAGAIAIQLPKKIVNDTIETKTLWEKKPGELPKKDRYYASPVVHEGLLYVVTQGSTFAVLDAKTGQEIYKKVLDIGKGTVFPSIALAGRYLMVGCDTGLSAVLEPGREYKEVAINSLEPFRSTPVFAGKRMYVRTLKTVYCVGR